MIVRRWRDEMRYICARKTIEMEREMRDKTERRERASESDGMEISL